MSCPSGRLTAWVRMFSAWSLDDTLFGGLCSGFVCIKANIDGFYAGLFEQAYMIRCKAVCAKTGDGVFDTGIDQRKTVDDRFGEDDLFTCFSCLAVKKAVSFAR